MDKNDYIGSSSNVCRSDVEKDDGCLWMIGSTHVNIYIDLCVPNLEQAETEGITSLPALSPVSSRVSFVYSMTFVFDWTKK